MQSRKLDRIGLFFISALEHGDERHVLHKIKQSHAIGIRLALEPPDQLQRVLPFALRRLFVKRIVQITFVLNSTNQIIQNIASGLSSMHVLACFSFARAILNTYDEFTKGAQGFQLPRIETRLNALLE